MFNLENSIANWRSSSSCHDSFNADIVEELESHLRQETAELSTNSDLTDEEAFLVASHRLGSSAALATEFSNANPGQVWMTRLFWGIFGYLMVTALLALISTVSKGASWIAASLGAGSSLPTVQIAICITLFVGVTATIVGACRYLSRYGLRGMERRITRHPIPTAIISLGVIGLLRTIGLVAQVGLARAVDVEIFARSSILLGYYSMASYLILLLALATTLVLLGKKLYSSASPSPI